MSRRLVRFMASACLAIVMGGCGLLWAPLEDRDNPADPEAGGELTLRLLDNGTVQAASPIDTGALVVSNFSYSVILFDLADLPGTVSSAVLTLQCSACIVPQDVTIWPILRSWDPDTITLAEVDSAGFLVSAPASTVHVGAVGGYAFDLTPAVTTMVHGVAVKGMMSGSVSFHSSATTGMEPSLHVVGHD